MDKFHYLLAVQIQIHLTPFPLRENGNSYSHTELSTVAHMCSADIVVRVELNSAHV